MSPHVRFDSVCKRYGAAIALDRVEIAIERGAFVTLLGPSGSGKSTALMALAGFVLPDCGRILLGGRDIGRVPPERRGFGVVFQGYALFPHLSVQQNIAYPLAARGEGRAAIEAKVRRALDLVQLDGLAERRPAQLSGGQQQRVAIARALVYDPPLLLLDEPMSALDRKLRGELQAGLKELHARLGTTFVNVTHDQDEALGLSTDIVVLDRGRVVQQGSPAAIYDRPETAFVADFIGNANLVTLADCRPDGDAWTGRAGGQALRFCPRQPLAPGDAACLAIRPERLSLAALPGGNRLPGTVRQVEPVGPLLRAAVEVPGLGRLQLALPRSTAPSLAVGEPVTLAWTVADGIHVRPA